MNTNTNFWTSICEYKYEYEYLTHTDWEGLVLMMPGQQQRLLIFFVKARQGSNGQYVLIKKNIYI